MDESDTVDPAEMVALAEELEEVVVQLEVKCNEVEQWKSNFEGLQNDCSERTSELENVTSQLQKSKHDGNSAVEKLKKYIFSNIWKVRECSYLTSILF